MINPAIPLDDAQAPPQRSLGKYLPLLSILLIGLGLRLYMLDAKSIWGDEIGVIWAARQGFWAALAGASQHVGAAPVDYLVTLGMLQFGSDAFALRLPAVLWGVLALYLIYRFGTYWFGSALVGFVAAGLLAVAPIHIQYSQEVRFYSLFTMITLLDVQCFLAALQRPSQWAWVRLGAIFLASIYVHYYTVLLLLACGIFLALRSGLLWWQARKGLVERSTARQSLRQLFGFTAIGFVACLAFLPWLLYARSGLEQRFQFTLPSAHEIYVWTLSWPMAPNLLVAYGIFLPLALLGIWNGLRTYPMATSLCLCLILTGVPSIVLLDFVFSYFFVPRQLLFLLPFFFIFVALGLTTLINRLLRWPWGQWLGLGVALIGITVLLLPQLSTYYNWPKENWRDTAHTLRANIKPNALTVLLIPQPWWMFVEYFEPSLSSYIGHPEALTHTAAQRVWMVTREPNLATIVGQTGFQGILLFTIPERSAHVYYLGRVTPEELWAEASHFDLPLQVVAYSDLLSELARRDPALASARIALIEMQLNSPLPTAQPLLGFEHAALLYRLGQAYRELGDQAAAAELFTTLLARHPYASIAPSAKAALAELGL